MSYRTSRRRFLVGAGAAALALPTLELFAPRTARAAGPPPRLLAYYFPNGRRPEWWVPSGGQGNLSFPGQASALQPFAGQVLALQNLSNNAAIKSPGAAHAMGTGTVMTGTAISTVAGGVVENSVSLDQLLVQQLAPQTRFNSLQWSAGEPGPCDVGGSSCAYTQSLSWTGKASPLVATIDPRVAFERLFGRGVDGLEGDAAELRRITKRSVIDMVDADAKALQTILGKTDRETLSDYFDALRDLEKSLDAGDSACAAEATPPVPGLDYPGRVAAFHELIRLAFLCDQTRFLTFMVEFGLSGRSHDFLGAPGGHHALSHFGDQGAKDRLEKVETWQNKQLGALLGLLRDTPGSEGGSLLDETIVLAIPSMGEGSSHDHGHNCPMLFGGAGVIAADGRKIAFPGDAPARLTDLHVSLLKAYGVEGSFGKDGAIFGDDGVAPIDGVVL
ncbi:MAG: DUF1552 domain-containing protein [Myxococcales bacterium]|nr:DUF1552 domain-containing protein [Myxococcales bacterium]